MTPEEQYLDMVDCLRYLKQVPRHFSTADHVPMKQRAPMFGLTTVDDNTWLIGDRVVITRSGQPWPDHTPGLINSWKASDGAHYAVLEASVPPPPSRAWAPDRDTPTLAHIAIGTAGGAISIKEGPDADLPEALTKVVYSVGDVFIKMHHTTHSDAVAEHETINELRRRLPDRTFALPEVLYHARYDDRYFLITSRVPGQQLEKLWWGLSDDDKNHYAELIAQACLEVATVTSDSLGAGIDGSALRRGCFQQCLTRKDKPDMVANCRMLDLDVEGPFCIFQEDLGPTNVIIDPDSRTVGIIDWERADFVPREWSGMSFARALGMRLDDVLVTIPEGYTTRDYADRVWKLLQGRGFSNDGEAWLDWKMVDWQTQ